MAACALVAFAAVGVAAPPPAAARTAAVVVQTTGDTARVAGAVRRAGGTVTLDLPVVRGFAARVPETALTGLRRLPGVRAITLDDHVQVAADASGTVNPQTVDSVYVRETNADRLHDEGLDGEGVRIALVDTGVSPVGDLAGRLVPVRDPVSGTSQVACINFSGEAGCSDSYGHGTFLAGLIAGSGAASAGAYAGIAPGAGIVSIKIAGRDGSADVSKVLAAIQWVVSFREEYGIRVLNLSLGTDSRVSYRFDPLNFAVERAWQSGLVVAVAASNRGPDPGTISKPGDDPLVVTVGAVDDRESPGIDDDRLPRFSGRGPTPTDGLAKPDLVAPGGKVVSLRAPGSHVEQSTPPGVLAGTPYRRGSGTSMSTAIVSGAAALLLQAHPTWVPDRVKFALTATARKVAERDPAGVGAGLVDVYAATRTAPAGLANQGITALSNAVGSLDGSRGSVLVTGRCGLGEQIVDPQCMVVHGNETAQGVAYDRDDYVASAWDGSSWYDSQWAGSSWYGSSWYGSSWYGSSWYGSSWYGSMDETGYGATVSGSSWYGAWD